MKNFFLHWKENAQYFDALGVLASLSHLFSISQIPYLDYRLAENIFCKFYQATNNARSCTAYDATVANLGIGIKTFILRDGQSSEKVAEFNRLKPQLDPLDGYDLAIKLAEFRNARIEFADNLYSTENRIYHIVGRDVERLRVFNDGYDFICKENIKVRKSDKTSISFTDGMNEYLFNRSKSVLMKKFFLPKNDFVEIPISIIEDPLENLLSIFGVNGYLGIGDEIKMKSDDYVILPLYSVRDKIVPLKSGLNQWNAEGRPRHPDEIYIPIPREIHKKHPNFFPPRDEHFSLRLPNGKFLKVKVCQMGNKALMSEPNKDLGKWLLRDVLKKKEGDLVTMKDLNLFGIDSIRLTNECKKDENGLKIYAIMLTSGVYESYNEFIM